MTHLSPDILSAEWVFDVPPPVDPKKTVSYGLVKKLREMPVGASLWLPHSSFELRHAIRSANAVANKNPYKYLTRQETSDQGVHGCRIWKVIR